MMQFYTRTGDKGTTALMGGQRVPKDDIRLEVVGTVDELNSWLGVAIAKGAEFPKIQQELRTIQHLLFRVGHDFATPDATAYPYQVDKTIIHQLEKAIDRHSDKAPDLTSFILPGGHPLACDLHYARTITRRLERLAVAFTHQYSYNEQALIVINRLSDYFFVLARAINVKADVLERTEPLSNGVFHPSFTLDD
ncbi:MAG: cob(I)yrinic acid a,c-diamide adenosyltransferase [Aerococcus sp.]|nr:cob(I)yrinic acid a,c-diamide adenosyltransferase [Aerococcus sp.]